MASNTAQNLDQAFNMLMQYAMNQQNINAQQDAYKQRQIDSDKQYYERRKYDNYEKVISNLSKVGLESTDPVQIEAAITALNNFKSNDEIDNSLITLTDNSLTFLNKHLTTLNNTIEVSNDLSKTMSDIQKLGISSTGGNELLNELQTTINESTIYNKNKMLEGYSDVVEYNRGREQTYRALERLTQNLGKETYDKIWKDDNTFEIDEQGELLNKVSDPVKKEKLLQVLDNIYIGMQTGDFKQAISGMNQFNEDFANELNEISAQNIKNAKAADENLIKMAQENLSQSKNEFVSGINRDITDSRNKLSNLRDIYTNKKVAQALNEMGISNIPLANFSESGDKLNSEQIIEYHRQLYDVMEKMIYKDNGNYIRKFAKNNTRATANLEMFQRTDNPEYLREAIKTIDFSNLNFNGVIDNKERIMDIVSAVTIDAYDDLWRNLEATNLTDNENFSGIMRDIAPSGISMSRAGELAAFTLNKFESMGINITPDEKNELVENILTKFNPESNVQDIYPESLKSKLTINEATISVNDFLQEHKYDNNEKQPIRKSLIDYGKQVTSRPMPSKLEYALPGSFSKYRQKQISTMGDEILRSIELLEN